MKIIIDMPVAPPRNVALRKVAVVKPAACNSANASSIYNSAARASARYFNALLEMNRAIQMDSVKR